MQIRRLLQRVQGRRWMTAADAKGPFEYIQNDLESISSHIESLVAQRENKVVDHAAGYLLKHKGKMLRPAIVALSGYAAMPSDVGVCKELHGGMTMMEMMKDTKESLDDLNAHPFNKHLRLAEVTELVHTASLIHDDVLDESVTRRGEPSLHTVVGIKVAVLTGDYLLARASHWLATLGDNRVVQCVSQALEDLTVGEVMQMEGSNNIEVYLKKSFNKTSSLIAHSCKGAALLSQPTNEEVHEAIFAYGKHLGLAFQIVDDILDFTSTDSEMGKPAMADLKAGVVTLPVCFFIQKKKKKVLLSAERNPKMKMLLDRKFCMEHDVEEALQLVQESEVLLESKIRAQNEVKAAITALESIPDSSAKESMIKLTDIVLTRRK